MKTLQKAEKRYRAYAWVTRIAQLMAGEKQCVYPHWLMTQYNVQSLSSDYDSSEHDEMVIDRATGLQEQGFSVTVESANSFKINGKQYHLCIAGRPDIIAVKDGWIVVEDCKSGKRKEFHRFQVLIYMMLLCCAPETRSLCNGHIPHGRLVYPDEIVEIPHWLINDDFRGKFRQALDQLMVFEMPSPQASHWECKFCRLPSAYCSHKQSMEFRSSIVQKSGC